MYSLFSVLTCLIFSFRQRWPMNFTQRNQNVMFRNGHEVSSRVGDMSRTFKHLFAVINIQHTFLIHVSEQGKFSW